MMLSATSKSPGAALKVVVLWIVLCGCNKIYLADATAVPLQPEATKVKTESLFVLNPMSFFKGAGERFSEFFEEQSLCRQIRAKQKLHREQLRQQWECDGSVAARDVKKRLKLDNGGISFDEYQLLQKGKDNFNKASVIVIFTIMVPRSFTTMMFFPQLHPTQFQRRLSSYTTQTKSEKLSQERSFAAMKTIFAIETGAVVNAGRGLFGGSKRNLRKRFSDIRDHLVDLLSGPNAFSSQYALNKLDNILYSVEEKKAGAALDDVPDPIIKGLLEMIPTFTLNIAFRRRQILHYIRRIERSDNFLVSESVDISTLSTASLLEACNDRFLDCVGRSEEELRDSLQCWLELTMNGPTKRTSQTGQHFNSDLARATLLGFHALDSCRNPKSPCVLPKLIYQKQQVGEEEGNKVKPTKKRASRHRKE